MTGLEQLAEEYLQTRRALGYKLTSQGRILAGFVQYLNDVGANRITVEAALAFATEPKDAQPIGGRVGCRWSAASQTTCTPSTRRPRCRRSACSLEASHEPRPTRTRRAKSPR